MSHAHGLPTPVVTMRDPAVSAILRLALGRGDRGDAVVLVPDLPAGRWRLVAGTPHTFASVSLATVTALCIELDETPAVDEVHADGLTAHPLRDGRGLLGVLVSWAGRPTASARSWLDDLRSCLTTALGAGSASTGTEFVERSARAVRRLFVEGAHAQDIREAGTVLARVAADAFQTERAGMYVIDDDGLISFAVGVGVTAELSDALAASLNGKVASDSPVWQALERRGGPQVVDDVRLAEARPGGFVETMEFRSYVAIPLLSNDGPLGMVICGDASRPRAWNVRERDLAEQFALEAALIIDAARLRTAQRAQLARLTHLAHHDGLTGLANRRHLMNRIDDALRSACRYGTTVAMLLLDLNDFKRVNDTLGHRSGDELLREVSVRLQATLRSSDTLARLGGDEFAIVLSGGSGRAEALAAADRIEAALAEPVVLDGIPLQAVVSVGIAVFPEHADSAADLLQHADLAMYEAKRSRNGAVVYDGSGDDATIDRLTLYTELRSAIAGEQLRLLYQPKLDLARNVVTGVESLVRWQHPRRGLLLPADFLPLAEASELIHPLTAWVVERALRDQHEWSRQGLELDVAVNVSARNLLNSDLIEQMRRAIIANGRPGRFVVEVTETAVMTNPDQSTHALNALRDLGVRISVDDFGTGHSSLALLSQLPVDELKIDRQLVTGAGDRSADHALVDTIIHLGHRLGLRVVGEGIEAVHTLRILQDLGCDLGQGNLISRPVSPDRVAEQLALPRIPASAIAL